jgi:hypothetical protein
MLVFEASVMPEAETVTVQVVSGGRFEDGVSVYELAGDALVSNVI